MSVHDLYSTSSASFFEVTSAARSEFRRGIGPVTGQCLQAHAFGWLRPPFLSYATFTAPKWGFARSESSRPLGTWRRRHIGAGSAHSCRAPSINCTLRPFPSLATARIPQQKILEDEFPLARPQRTAASTARYLAIVGFWAGLDFDDVVERTAMWAFKKRLTRGRNVRRFAPHSHGTPPQCCNEHRRYVFGGPRAIRLRPGPLRAGHQCRGPFLSSVTRAIGEIAGGSSIPPRGLQASHKGADVGAHPV